MEAEKPPLAGFQVKPMLSLVDFSGLSALEPSATAAGFLTGKVRMSNGTPPMKFVEVALKLDWARCGARNPVLTEPRTANSLVNSKRVANLTVLLLPKSL